jgi:hypothetical protein
VRVLFDADPLSGNYYRLARKPGAESAFSREVTGANCVMAHEKAIISPQKLTQECSILAQELPLEGRF